MRNNRGITIVALVVTVIILIVLASMTAITSIDAYNQMQYETFKAELEELQKAVDVVAEEYKMASEVNTYADYSEFFSNYYGRNIGKLEASSILLSYQSLYREYEAELSGGEIYLFTPDDIKKVLNIKGIEEDFIINFSTRRVYSTVGHKDPNGDNRLVYRLSDSALTTNFATPQNDSALKHASIEFPAKAQEYNIDGTTMYKVILRIRYEEDPNNAIARKYDIEKIECSVNNKVFEIENFEQYFVQDGEDILKELSFIVYEAPATNTYISFKVFDTEGVSLVSPQIARNAFK